MADESTTQTATIDAPATTEKAPADFMSDVIGDFEQMDSNPPEPSKKTAEKPKSSKPTSTAKKTASKTAEDTKSEKVEESDKTTEEEQKPTSEKPTVEKSEEIKPEGTKSHIRTLGEKYDNLKKEVEQTYKPELQKLRAKVQEFESKKPEDSAPLLQKVKELEERNNHLEAQIELANFEESKPYQEHQKKFADAWNRALKAFGQLEVTEKIPDGEDEVTGEPKFKFQTRSATEEDLLELSRMSIGKMDKRAKEMFQDSSPRVIAHIETIKELWDSKENAKHAAAEKAKEWKSRHQAEINVRSQTLAKTWDEVNKNLQEKLPRAFNPDAEDDVDKQAFVKGFALADLTFFGEAGLTPEQIEVLPNTFRETIKSKQPLSDAQKVQLHALARLQIGNNYRQLLWIKRANEQIKELKKTVEEYEQSEPGGDKAGDGGRKSGTTKDWLQEAGDELKALDR